MRVANPIFKEGIKPGTHRIGEGVEKKIRLRSIRSPQALVDEKKVQKLARFKKTPGMPTVSHVGHGVYTLKDGNHRVNAALRKGKRVIVAKVQKFEADDEPVKLLYIPHREHLKKIHKYAKGERVDAMVGGKNVGYLISHPSFNKKGKEVDEQYLRSLKVDPEYRRRGIAKMLMRDTVGRNSDKWQALKPEPFDDKPVDLETLRKLYSKFGFHKDPYDEKYMLRAPGPIQFDDPQPHQQRVIRRIQEPGRPGLVVVHGLGSGKTRTAIEVHKTLGGDADVVLPASLQENYRKELKKWEGDEARTKIITQQNLSLRGRRALKSPLLIVDEGHRARNPKAKLSEAIKGSPAQKRLILSGTPLYNQPEDIATLVNQAAGRQVIREGKQFERRYLNPGFIDRIRGKRISHEGELKGILKKFVDYHKGDPSVLPAITSRVVPVDMTEHQSRLYRASLGSIPRGMKLDRERIERLTPYLTGARQVSNTARALDPDSSDEPKLDRVFKDLKEHLGTPKGKALVYSNWLDHGVRPIQKRLDEAKIPYGIFTGDETLKSRNRAVKDYNEDKLRTLLVSSSGAEGLDLKGTRLVQVVEPHFNNAKLRQVVGRSARIGSHTHLPEEDRNVEVRSYIARPKKRFFKGTGRGVEDILAEAARNKDETDRQITALFHLGGKPIELGVLSIGTAKKILREIRKENPGLSVLRPEGATVQAQYVSKKTSRRMLDMARGQYAWKRDINIKPHTVIMPRQEGSLTSEIREMRESLKSFIPNERFGKIQKRAWDRMDSLSEPLGMGLHEHGHASMPPKTVSYLDKVQRQSMKSGGVEMTHPYWKTAINEEYRANRDILSRIQRHGTPKEAHAWKRRSQDQIKEGYRNKIFTGALMAEATKEEASRAMNTMVTPLSLKRRVLQKYPHIRRQQMSSNLRPIQFAWADNLISAYRKSDIPPKNIRRVLIARSNMANELRGIRPMAGRGRIRGIEAEGLGMRTDASKLREVSSGLGINPSLSQSQWKRVNAAYRRALKLSSGIKPIEFAKPGEMSKKYLVGTHWGDTEEGRQAVEEATKHVEPREPDRVVLNKPVQGKSLLQKIPASKADAAAGRSHSIRIKDEYVRPDATTGEQLRMPKASDFRNTQGFNKFLSDPKLKLAGDEPIDIDAFRKRLAKVVRTQRSIARGLVERPKEDVSAAFRRVLNHRAAQRKAGVKNLQPYPETLNKEGKRLTMKDVEARRLRQSQQGIDIVPDRVFEKAHQHGSAQSIDAEGIKKVRGNLEILIGNEKIKKNDRYKRLYNHLVGRASENMAGGIKVARDLGSGEFSGWDDVKIGAHARGKAEALVSSTLSSGLTISRGPGKKGPGLPRPVSDYEELATYLRTEPEHVRKIHQHYKATRNPREDLLAKRFIESGRAFGKTPEKITRGKPKPKVDPIYRHDLKEFPLFKKVGIGAGLVGAGLLAGALWNRRKKKDQPTQEMSSRLKPIEFMRVPGTGRGRYYMAAIGRGRNISQSAMLEHLGSSPRLAAVVSDTKRVNRKILPGDKEAQALFAIAKKRSGKKTSFAQERNAAARELKYIYRPAYRAGKYDELGIIPVQQKMSDADWERIRKQPIKGLIHRKQERPTLYGKISDLESELGESRIKIQNAEATAMKRHEAASEEMKGQYESVLEGYKQDFTKGKEDYMSRAAVREEGIRKNYRRAIGATAIAGIGAGIYAGRKSKKTEQPVQFGVKDKVYSILKKLRNWKREQLIKNPVLGGAMSGYVRGSTMLPMVPFSGSAGAILGAKEGLQSALNRPSLGHLILRKAGSQRRKIEFAKKDKELNPIATMASSSALTGAIFGGVSAAINRGGSLKRVLASAGTGAAIGAGVGGGSALIGDLVVGKADPNDPTAYTRRGAIGGTIAGGALGAGAAVIAKTVKRKLPFIGSPAERLKKAARRYPPLDVMRRTNIPGAIIIGGAGGAAVGGFHGADEGQQVDTIRNLRRRHMSDKTQPLTFEADAINRPGNKMVKYGFKVHKAGKYTDYAGTGALGAVVAGRLLYDTQKGLDVADKIARSSKLGSKAIGAGATIYHNHKGKILGIGGGLLAAGAGLKWAGNKMIKTGFESRGDRLKRRAKWQVKQARESMIGSARDAIHQSAFGNTSKPIEFFTLAEALAITPWAGAVGGVIGATRKKKEGETRTRNAFRGAATGLATGAGATAGLIGGAVVGEAIGGSGRIAVPAGLLAGGYLAHRLARKKSEKPKPVEFASSAPSEMWVNQGLTGKLAADKYRKKIKDDDADKRDSNILRTALAGAGLAALIRGKMPLRNRALIGAGSGAATVIGIRAVTSRTKDPYGERSREAKKIESLPAKAAALTGLGILGVRGYRAIKGVKLPKAPKLFSAIEFADPNLEALQRALKSEDIEIRKRKGQRQPRHWYDKWLGGRDGNINITRRGQDLQTYYRRTGGLLKDVKGSLSGEPALDERGRPRKREWDKPWVKAALFGGVAGIAALSGKKVIKIATQGSGELSKFRGKLATGAVGDALSRKFPGPAGLIKKVKGWVSGIGQQAGDESHSALNKGFGKINKWVDETLEKPVHAADPPFMEGTIKGVTGQFKKGSREYNELLRKTKSVAQQEAERFTEEQKKRVGRGLTKEGGKHEYSSKTKPILFDEDTVYVDRWEDWVRNRPGVVKRDRRPKRFYETKVFDDTVIKGGLLGGGFAAGNILGALKATRPIVVRKNDSETVISKAVSSAPESFTAHGGPANEGGLLHRRITSAPNSRGRLAKKAAKIAKDAFKYLDNPDPLIRLNSTLDQILHID